MVAGNSRKQKTNVAGEKQRNMEAKRADREKGRVSGKFAKPMKPGERKLPGRKTDGREVEGRSTDVYKRQDPELAEQFQVMTIPTLILFRDGREVSSVVNPANRDAIEGWLKEHGAL